MPRDRIRAPMNAPPVPAAPVDVLLVGGRAYLGGAPPALSDWLAIRNGRIAALGVGTFDRDLRGARTRVVDVRGGTIVPGFQDAHIHPVHGGLAELRCELHDLADVAAYERAVRSYAAAHPDLAWIVGGGWSLAEFPRGTPRKETLDAIVSARPIFLTNRDGHGAWVNSKALEMANVTAATPDPADGRIERDPDGSPTGTLHEGAMDLVGPLAPPPTQ